MLPTIADYCPPPTQDLPANRASWQIDPSRAALLVHDMQRYFIDAYGPKSRVIGQTIQAIKRLRVAATSAGMPVYFTAQPPSQTPEQRGLLSDFWGNGIQDDGRHAIIDELHPLAPQDIITKWRYDAFVRTDLEQRLAGARRDQLIITGIYAHIGVLSTATSAFMRDVQPFVVADAIADFSLDDHVRALTFAATRCASVVDTATALAHIAAEPTASATR